MDRLIVQQLGLQPYQDTWQSMRTFVDARHEQTVDEFWVVEHLPVFTQGQAGKEEHVLNPGDIPLVQADRGGQVTYHGPGQLIVYLLLDIKRKKLGIKNLIQQLENAILAVLDDFGVEGHRRTNAPGIYVDKAKIAFIGLKIRKGCSYHGISLNVDMNLEPFSRINPCGYPNLPVTQLKDFDGKIDKTAVLSKLISHMAHNLGYTVS